MGHAEIVSSTAQNRAAVLVHKKCAKGLFPSGEVSIGMR
jgi:hypothetical protein